MTDTDDALFAARLHVHNGTMLSAEVVTEICKAYLELQKKDAVLRQMLEDFSNRLVVERSERVKQAIAYVEEAVRREAAERASGYDANGSETP